MIGIVSSCCKSRTRGCSHFELLTVKLCGGSSPRTLTDSLCCVRTNALLSCWLYDAAILLSDTTRKQGQHDRSTHQTRQRNSCDQESVELLWIVSKQMQAKQRETWQLWLIALNLAPPSELNYRSTGLGLSDLPKPALSCKPIS